MRSQYVPKKYAGKEVGLEGRITGLVGLGFLITASPVYFTAKAIERIVGNLDAPSLEEFSDTLKICYEVVIKGRLPQRV